MDKARFYVASTGLRHDTGPGHPENPARLAALTELMGEPAFDAIPVIKARECPQKPVLRVHSPAYLANLEESLPDRGYAFIDQDTVLSPHSWEAIMEAAGAVLQATDDVMTGACRRAFCAVRPPGHHAEPARAMGFCFLNNVAIGAVHALAHHGLSRVAVIDFDVHHGNGTEIVARQTEGLFYGSSQQDGLFPNSADPALNTPRIVNAMLPAGSGGKAFKNAYEQAIFPALRAFSPELIFLSAGFDAHRDDPLAGLELTGDDFGWVTREIVRIAEETAQGRIVSALEGGYDLPSLKNSARAHLLALCS